VAPDDTYEFSAICSRGVEDLLADELREVLGTDRIRVDRGAVRFRGALALGYRACMFSRLAGRVLMLIGRRDAWGERGLLEASRSVRWTAHFNPDQTFSIDFVGRDEDLRDTRHSARVVKDGICDRMRGETGRRPSVDVADADIRIHAHLRNRSVAFSLDMAGSLHLRSAGAARSKGPAPLKETLAAALLRAADWPALAEQGVPLFDPMCGTGTLLIEAAHMARNHAPGLIRRRWQFESWEGHQPRVWGRIVAEAEALSDAGASRPLAIHGADEHTRALFAAKENTDRAGVEVKLTQAPVDAITAPPGREEVPRGLLVTNPPYGVRLGEEEEVRELYGVLGDVLRRRFLGWTAWILAGPGLVPALGLKPSRRIPLFNGPIECRATRLDISTDPPKKLGPRRGEPPAPQ
jgi:23S rRNA (guanine2445-N2)-methyltransferase / 23S rRNA (guanine2069-N7)-methyltransferase